MPNAYTSGIANGQANASAGAGAFDPTKPWLGAPSFETTAMGNNADYSRVGWNYDANGYKGAGFYKAASPSSDSQMLGEQQYYTNQFNQNIPQLENQMGNQAASSISAKTDQNVQNTRQNNSSRGMLYSGINQGQEQGQRVQGAQQTAQARSGINSGLISAGQNMQSNAISTGVSYQQMQQQLYNSIYGQAMQSLNSDTAMTNSVVGSAATIGAIAAFSPASAPAAAAKA